MNLNTDPGARLPPSASANANSSNSSNRSTRPVDRQDPHWAADLHVRLRTVSKEMIEGLPDSPIRSLLLEGEVPRSQEDFELCVNFLAWKGEYTPVLSELLLNTTFESLTLYVLPQCSAEKLFQSLRDSRTLQRLTIIPFSSAEQPAFLQACSAEAHILGGRGASGKPVTAADCMHLGNFIAGNPVLQHLVVAGSDIGSAGAAAIAEGLKQNLCLEFLKLSHANLGDAGAAVLGQALGSHPGLVTLNLAFGQIGPEGAAGLAQALRVNEKLSGLTLSGNRIADAGLRHLMQALDGRKTPLGLDLGETGITLAGVRPLSDALESGRCKLGGLILSNNRLGDAEAELLCKGLRLAAIQWLDLSGNEIGPAGAKAIAQILPEHGSLRRLDLSNNPLADGAVAIGAALKKNPLLETLDLQACGIDAHACLALAAGLRENQHLAELSLSNNAGGMGAIAILQAIAQHPSLEYLGLAHNAITAACFAHAGDAFPANRSLRTLDMESNGCGDAGAKWLAKGMGANTRLAELLLAGNAIGREGAEALFLHLAGNTGLQTFDLRSNRFALDRSVVKALKTFLSTNRDLRTLYLQGNPFKSSMVVDQLAVALRGNPVILDFELGAFAREVEQLIAPILRQNRLLVTDEALQHYLVGAAAGLMQAIQPDVDGAGTVLGAYLLSKGELTLLGRMARVSRRSRDAAEAAYALARQFPRAG